MKIFLTKKLMLLLFCLVQEVLNERSFLRKDNSFKPFISVVTPESMKQFEQSSSLLKGESQKSIKMFASEGDDKSTGEKMLREISFSVKCIFVDDFNLYDISSLGLNTIKNNVGGHNQTFKDANIYYNFCYDLKISKIDGCKSLEDQKKQIVAVRKKGTEEVCEALSDSINKGNKWSKWEDTDKEIFLQIELNNNNQSHKVFYRLKCNKDQSLSFNESRSLFEHKEEDGTYKTILFFETKEACVKYDFYVVWKFINDYKVIFAIGLIVFGFFNCILGQKFAKITSFLITLFTVIILVLIFSQFILLPGSAQWIIWVMLSLGIILGCTAGYFVFKYHEKFFSLLVGGLAGFFLGEFLFNLFGNSLPLNLTLVHILFIIICIIALIILAFFLKDIIIIFATSFIGAYTLIRGVSLIAGYFPSEFTVIDLKQRGETEQLKDLLTWRVYIYLVFILVLTGLSIFIQIKINKGIKAKKEAEECPDSKLLSS